MAIDHEAEARAFFGEEVFTAWRAATEALHVLGHKSYAPAGMDVVENYKSVSNSFFDHMRRKAIPHDPPA